MEHRAIPAFERENDPRGVEVAAGTGLDALVYLSRRRGVDVPVGREAQRRERLGGALALKHLDEKMGEISLAAPRTDGRGQQRAACVPQHELRLVAAPPLRFRHAERELDDPAVVKRIARLDGEACVEAIVELAFQHHPAVVEKRRDRALRCAMKSARIRRRRPQPFGEIDTSREPPIDPRWECRFPE